MDSGVDSEVVFNTGAHEEDVEEQEEKTTPDSRIPPTPITQCDMDVIIRGGRRNSPEWQSACARCKLHPRELARTCASWDRRHERSLQSMIGACQTSYKV